MADETTFARLVAAVVRDLERQVEEDRGTGLGYCDADDPKMAKIDGNVDLSAIVRALLTVLRKAGPEVREALRYTIQTFGVLDTTDPENTELFTGGEDKIMTAVIDAILAEGQTNG